MIEINLQGFRLINNWQTILSTYLESKSCPFWVVYITQVIFPNFLVFFQIFSNFHILAQPSVANVYKYCVEFIGKEIRLTDLSKGR